MQYRSGISQLSWLTRRLARKLALASTIQSILYVASKERATTVAQEKLIHHLLSLPILQNFLCAQGHFYELPLICYDTVLERM